MSEQHHPTLMTPEQAKAKLCHVSLAASEYEKCLADGCMAWRWSPFLTVNNPTRAPGAAIQHVKYTHGFCGLAGKP